MEGEKVEGEHGGRAGGGRAGGGRAVLRRTKTALLRLLLLFMGRQIVELKQVRLKLRAAALKVEVWGGGSDRCPHEEGWTPAFLPLSIPLSSGSHIYLHSQGFFFRTDGRTDERIIHFL